MLLLSHLHKKKKQRVPYTSLDYLVYIISFVGPILTIPQIYDVWIRKDFSVNVITWGSYIIIEMIWLYYGIINKVRPIILSNCLWILVNGLVILGALLYK